MPQQTKHQDRVIFLQAFAKEIIFNVKKQQEIKEEEEKNQKKRLEKEIQKPIEARLVPQKPRFALSPLRYSARAIHPIHPTYPFQPKTREIGELGGPIEIKPRAQSFHPQQFKLSSQLPIQLPAQATGEEAELNLGKLNPFKTDKEITMIECTGPGKFIVVKKAGRVNFTRISLSQSEIDNILKNFSVKTRIPVIGGVFKASVGNLTIAAVISEFVGSRFIITKAGPYSILEQQAQELGQAQFQHSREIQRQFQKGKLPEFPR